MESNEVPIEVVRTSFREAPWRWSDIVIGLVPIVTLTAANYFIPDYKDLLPAWLATLISLSGQGWLLLYPLVMVRRRGVEPRRPKVSQIAFEAIFTLPSLMAIWMVLVIVVSLWTLVAGQPVTPGNPIQSLVESLNPWVILALGALAVGLAPISEELFFRGMVYNKFRSVMPLWLAIILQGFLFGFVHTFGFTHAVLASILGMGLALVYELRGKLVASMLVHALQNFTALTLTVLLTLVLTHQAKLGIVADPHAQGLLIKAIEPGSPAEKAGLQPGDILVAMDDVRLHNVMELRVRLVFKGGGDQAKLTYLRDGQQHDATVKFEGPPVLLPELKLPPQSAPPVVPTR